METLIVVVIIAVVAGLMGRSAYRTLTNSSKQGGCGCGETDCSSKSLCLTDKNPTFSHSSEGGKTGENSSGVKRPV